MSATLFVAAHKGELWVALMMQVELLVHLLEDPRLHEPVMPRRATKCAIREEESGGRNQFHPPASLDDDQLAVETPEAPVRDAEPPARPADAPFPDSRAPYQQRRDNPGHETHLLGHIDDPVHGAANTDAILARRKEERVAKAAGPDGQEGQKECMLASACPERQVLCAE